MHEYLSMCASITFSRSLYYMTAQKCCSILIEWIAKEKCKWNTCILSKQIRLYDRHSKKKKTKQTEYCNWNLHPTNKQTEKEM